MIKKLLPPAASGFWCAIALTLSASATYAADLVNDTWRDTNRNTPASPIYSETGTDADADGNTESAWFLSNGGSIVDDAVPGGDQILRMPIPTGSAGMTTIFTSNSAVTLSSTGDKLRVTWSFVPLVPATNSNTSQNFRLCVVDWPTATARITTDAQPASAAYAGYGMLMNMATNLGGNAFSLYRRTDPLTASAILSASGSWTSLASDSTAPGTNGYSDGTNYTYVMELTRINGTDIEIISTMSGGNIGGDGQLQIIYTNAPAQTFSFDTFSVRPSSALGAAERFDTTLFKAEFTAGCTPGTSYNVTGTGSFCPGDPGVAVSLSGSDVGVDYQLQLGGVDVGSPTNGTGAAIGFGLQATAGTYTVVASNTTSGCVGAMSGSAIITENVAPTISVNPSPVDATNSVGDTRVFSVTATGTGPFTYQWRTNGVDVGNGGNISGATSNSITITSLTTNNAGSYDCVVSGTCSPPATSAAANLTVLTIPGDLFRSFASGLWEDASTWEQSSNGVTWIQPAAAPPSSTASNITVLTGHTVTVNADATVDEVTIQAGAIVSVANGNLTINNGAAATDFTVAGTLQVEGGAGLISVGSAALSFASGGAFDWIRSGIVPAIPLATWQDGSTCRISATASSTANATGFSGQSFYDFVYDTTAQGQSARCRLDLQGTATTVRRDFSITIPDTANASVTINNTTGGILTVGRHVTFVTGTTVTSTKVLLNSAAGNSLLLKVGGNFSASGVLDGFGSSTSVIEFNGTGTQSLTLPLIQPAGTNLITSSAMNWLVKSNSTVALGSRIDGFSTFTNQGTLTFNSNLIAGGSTLALDTTGLVNGNGTNQLSTTNLATIVAGGTLNLGALPTFAGGESFLLFGAAAHSGTFGTLLPATPDGTHTWVTTQLNSDGILAVSGGGPSTTPTNITTVVGGGNLTLSWPDTHTGWTLQTQTNSRSVGLVPATNAWFDVSGSSTTNQVVIPIGPTEPTVFYRLRLPQ